MPSFKIVTNGRPIEGRDRNEVASALAALFKKTTRGIAPLLAGKPVLIKRGLDEQTARRMASSLKEAGLMVRVEPDSAEGTPTSAEGTLVSAPRSAKGAPTSDEASSLSDEPGATPDLSGEAASAGPHIVSLALGATDLRHTVIYCTSLSSSGRGLNFHRPDNMDVRPSEVAAISAYRIVHREEPSDMLMIYLSASPRPLVTNANAIKYWTFPAGTAGPSQTSSLRGLIRLILKVNPSVLIDEGTARFLDNPSLDPPQIKKDENTLSAALAKAVEDAGMFRAADVRTQGSAREESAAKKPSRNERVLRSILSSKPTRSEDLPPIRGTLIVLAVAMLLMLGWNALSSWRYIDMAWNMIRLPGPMRFMANYIVLAFELAANLVLLAMAIKAARLMMRRSMTFPVHIVKYLKLSLAYSAVQYLLPQLIGLARGFGHALNTYAFAGIGSVLGRPPWRLWYLLDSGLLAYAIAFFVIVRYLKRSERARQTFVGN